MITIGFCTREHNQPHIDELVKSCGLDKNKIEVIEIVNHGDKSLTECYNEILTKANNDIIVYLHDDVSIKENWGNKILKHFKRSPGAGIIGIAGTKFLDKSGRWWVDPKKMIGRVSHTSEGKTWLSAYSKDQGNQLEEVVLVDGLFFAINRKNIKHKFDESVMGFHFYDVSFCVENYLDGVKIYVCTDVQALHMSIGITPIEWEQNRILFADKYKDSLPLNIKKTFGSNDKLKVLIGCLSFAEYTGSELYFYELAKELVKQGCDVSVCSQLKNGDLAKRAAALGIKVFDLKEPPGFKLGDGKFSFKTENGEVLSKENTLYPITPTDFDILHLSHKPIVEHLMKLYPNVPVIETIHSEVIELEYPVIDERIKKYIAIRPEIKSFLMERFDIPEEKISVIYNPINYEKFRPLTPRKKHDKKVMVFIATIDYLREATIMDLVIQTRKTNQELWLVGKNNGVDLNKLIGGLDHVKHFEPTWEVEEYIRECDYSAGIMLGRSTIESWMCGKPAWIYEVDKEGAILSKKLYEVPEDIAKFRSDTVANQIKAEYINIIE